MFLTTRPPARPEQFTWTEKTKNNRDFARQNADRWERKGRTLMFWFQSGKGSGCELVEWTTGDDGTTSQRELVCWTPANKKTRRLKRKRTRIYRRRNTANVQQLLDIKFNSKLLSFSTTSRALYAMRSPIYTARPRTYIGVLTTTAKTYNRHVQAFFSHRKYTRKKSRFLFVF